MEETSNSSRSDQAAGIPASLAGVAIPHHPPTHKPLTHNPPSPTSGPYIDLAYWHALIQCLQQAIPVTLKRHCQAALQHCF